MLPTSLAITAALLPAASEGKKKCKCEKGYRVAWNKRKDDREQRTVD